MWSTRTEQLSGGRLQKVAIDQGSSPLAFAEVLRLWQDDEAFRDFFITLLADAPFMAFRWETPTMTVALAQRPFEFVLLDSPGLGSRPDQNAFAKHFRAAKAEESVVAFANLGRDALLVVPCPRGPVSAYGHLAAFIREAPQEQKHALWRLVGQVMQQQLGESPVWLSTAGAGVSWLHVRLDTTPKYYGYQPYRAVPGEV
jgi:hypothetical protein